MYKHDVFDGNRMVNEDGLQLAAETSFFCHETVQKVQCWSTGWYDVQEDRDKSIEQFTIVYQDGCIRDVHWKNLDAIHLRQRFCVSQDGKQIFIPDYDKGLFAVDTETDVVCKRYNIKHIFALWTTKKSLLCQHREYNAAITRIDLQTQQKVEEVRINFTTRFIPVTKSCIMYCKGDKYAVFANADDLQIRHKIPIKALLGIDAEYFSIEGASIDLTTSEMKVSYCKPRGGNSSGLVFGETTIKIPEETICFIQEQEKHL